MIKPFLLAAALAAPAATTAPAPAPDLQLVQQHLRGLSTMTADFAQTDFKGQTLTGAFTLKQPGHFRFQYQKGVPLLVVADGGALTFVDYQVKQVQRYPLKSLPLGVLIDPARDLGRYAHALPGVDPRLLSIEAAAPKHPEYGRIPLVFARGGTGPAGLTLQGWVQLDSQNNRTTVRLSNQRFGTTIGNDAFRWTDPRAGAKGPR